MNQSTRSQARWTPPEPEEVARLLPQLQITRMLGHGGMGAVYEGMQIPLNRSVAVKLLPVELATDPEFVDRFRREAQTLACLQHPGIVAIYDFGQTAEGHLYFIMEYVDGTDLLRILHGPGLSPTQALEFTIQLCEALHYAHLKGVVHRDIKPANVLLTRDGRAKLADFGLAALPFSSGDRGRSATSLIAGTPDYMAPEQWEGKADHRSDIFALGVMLYEMLTGIRPKGAFPMPSQRARTDVRLDDVVVKAMRPEPESRYQQVSELRSEIDQIRTTMLNLESAGNARTSSKSKSSGWMGWATAAGMLIVAGSILFFATRPAPKHSPVVPGVKETHDHARVPMASAPSSSATASAEIELFNGRDLSGWKGLPQYWSVKDGEIVGKSTAQNAMYGNTFLVWNGEVKDFELSLEFRLEADNESNISNSGVQFRALLSDPAKLGMKGYQVELDSGMTHPKGWPTMANLSGAIADDPGPLLCPSGSRSVSLAGGKGLSSAPARFRGPLETEAAMATAYRQGDWNACRVIAIGNHIQTFINGVLAADLVDEAKRYTSGLLGLQLHNLKKPQTVRFKRIRLKVLNSSPLEPPAIPTLSSN